MVSVGRKDLLATTANSQLIICRASRKQHATFIFSIFKTPNDECDDDGDVVVNLASPFTARGKA